MGKKTEEAEGRVLFIGKNMECSQGQVSGDCWFNAVAKLRDTKEFRKALVVMVQASVGSVPVIIKNQIGPV